MSSFKHSSVVVNNFSANFTFLLFIFYITPTLLPGARSFTPGNTYNFSNISALFLHTRNWHIKLQHVKLPSKDFY